MKIGFTKMHGCGNDYIYVNGAEAAIDEGKKEGVVRKLSDRHFGIGGDGVIFIHSLSGEDAIADFEMEMYNADGSRAEMCGNGIRCVAKYVYDHRLTDKEHIRIETKSGIKSLDLTVQDGKVSLVRVAMGAPILQAEEIPIRTDREQVLAMPIEVGGMEYRITGVSMGNPHAVVYLDDVTGFDIEKWGPQFETHPLFPDRINTEFCKVLDEKVIQMRVWERGSGETMACGTGACAAAVSSILNGYTKEQVTVRLLGGDLEIFWDRRADQVYMTGPAVEVFSGEIIL